MILGQDCMNTLDEALELWDEGLDCENDFGSNFGSD